MALTKKTSKPAAPAKPVAAPTVKQFVGGKTRPILVSLPGAPQVVVQASSTEDAWEKYKKVCGINGSDHRPKFARPGVDCVVNGHGIVVNAMGDTVLAETRKPDDGKGDWDLDEEDV